MVKFWSTFLDQFSRLRWRLTFSYFGVTIFALLMAEVIGDWSGTEVAIPDGAFYLWVPAEDGWDFARRLAHAGGALVSPGEFYGPDGARHVRIAVVQPDEQIEGVAERLRRNTRNG